MEPVQYVASIIGDGNLATLVIVIIVAFSVFVEVIPVKINPLSSILKYIGNCMFSDIGKRLDTIEYQMDLNEIDHIRWEILNFANSCRHGRSPGKDEYEHVISQNAKYKELVDKHKITNDVYAEEYNFILELYHKYQYEKLNSNNSR